MFGGRAGENQSPATAGPAPPWCDLGQWGFSSPGCRVLTCETRAVTVPIPWGPPEGEVCRCKVLIRTVPDAKGHSLARSGCYLWFILVTFDPPDCSPSGLPLGSGLRLRLVVPLEGAREGMRVWGIISGSCGISLSQLPAVLVGGTEAQEAGTSSAKLPFIGGALRPGGSAKTPGVQALSAHSAWSGLWFCSIAEPWAPLQPTTAELASH